MQKNTYFMIKEITHDIRTKAYDYCKLYINFVQND